MKLQTPFVQLPLQFDAERLGAEMDALGEGVWRDHPLKYPGNYAVPLIAVDGDPNSDGVVGPMRPTPYLERCPYLVQVLAQLGAVWGHTRLMKLAGGAEVTPHVDINYYWRERVRVHVPIRTQPGVRFLCGDAEVNMGAGECWLFDTWRPHRVVNVPERERVHLVADTVGGDRFWDIVGQGRAPGRPGAEGWRAERFDGDQAGDDPLARLMLESVNVPVVMTPWELREHLQFLLAHVQPDPRLAVVQQSAQRFAASWHALWSRFGEAPAGWPSFRALLDGFDRWLDLNAGTLELANGMGLVRTWRSMVCKVALSDHGHPEGTGESRDRPDSAPPPAASRGGPISPQAAPAAEFDRPVFIVSPPRSGSTMLFEALAQAPGVYTIGGENHRLVEVEAASGALGTIARGYGSNRLQAEDASDEIAAELRAKFYAALRDRDGRPATGRVRMLEKTPKNALRVPFLARVFPDAHFVYLYRDPREVMASMLEAWESGRFRTYPELPGWTGLPWSMLLVPGWRGLIGRALPEVVAAQWQATTRILLDDLDALPAGQRHVVRYDALVADPDATVGDLCSQLGLAWDRRLGPALPAARYTVSPPRAGKWRTREAEIAPALAGLGDTVSRAAALAGA